MDILIWVAVAIAVTLAALAIPTVRRWILGRSADPVDIQQSAAGFVLSELDPRGPPVGALKLELYGTAVCLRVVVLAPLGRGVALPDNDQLPHLLNHFMSGFTRLTALHRPLLIRWPEQLSASGFEQSFFNHAGLPGDHGRGSCWSAVAGRFSLAGDQFLIGLVCSTASADGLGEIVVAREGQWLDVVRIRELDT